MAFHLPKVNIDASYIVELEEYSTWEKDAPLPPVTTGPTYVDYYTANKKGYEYNPFTGLADADIKTIGVRTFKSIEEGKVSEKTLHDLCSLAVSLKAPNGQWVFTKVDIDAEFSNLRKTQDNTSFVPSPSTGPESTEYIVGILSKSSDVRGSESSQPNTLEQLVNDDPHFDKSIPYLACTFLRLATKEPEGWRRAMGQIKTQFGTFYGTPSNLISGFTPVLGYAQLIKSAFNTFKPITRFLALVAASTDKAVTLNSPQHGLFIYFLGQHLSYPGMHVYPLIVALLHKLKGVSPPLLLTFLTVEETRDAIRSVFKIATKLDAPSKTARSERDFAWKYARLIDEGFFLELQTKRNKELVYGLILLHKRLGLTSGATYADPENMAVLRGQTALRNDAEELAEIVMMLYREAVGTKVGATPTERLRAMIRGHNVEPSTPPRTVKRRQGEQQSSVSEDELMESASEPIGKKSKITAEAIDAMLRPK